ncbi:MAG: hypothetical protein Q9209_004176 [Squamulea sp. 1 TL-2023]
MSHPSSALPSRSILYQNKSQTVTLIDLPLSIALAQGTPDHPCTELLYSQLPLAKPHPSTEPRGAKAKQRVQDQFSNESRAWPPFPQNLLIQGLAEIRAEYPLAFCSKRITGLIQPTSLDEGQEKASIMLLEKGIGVLTSDTGVWHEPGGPLVLSPSLSSDGYEVLKARDLVNRAIGNPFAPPVLVHIAELDRKYSIPPFSTFMLSKIGHREACHFSRMITKLLPEPSLSAAPGQFDFILLDPPWDNRSVRRSKTYGTRRKADEDPLYIVKEMLGKHMAPGALIACWITNKASVRDAALEAFDSWGVELIEEWAWLKTTIHGEPICDMSGSMRRPYEIVLIGKTIDMTIDGSISFNAPKPTVKRLIVGVPDLHSRKPCLKELIEPMMRERSSYRALEIFARNLTAGWWSWGDEVLKYNWKGYWTEDRIQDDAGCSKRLSNDAVVQNKTVNPVEERFFS